MNLVKLEMIWAYLISYFDFNDCEELSLYFIIFVESSRHDYFFTL